MGLTGATGVGVSAIVGGGILALAGAAFASTGPSAILAFALNGVIAVLTVFSFAEVSSKFPQSGGTYTFAKKVLSVEAAFTVGWVVWFASIVAAVLYAVGFAQFASVAIADLWAGAAGAPADWLTGRAVVSTLAVAATIGYTISLLCKPAGGGGWVGEHQARTVDKGASDGDPLRLAPGQFERPRVCPVLQAHLDQRFFDLPVPRSGIDTLQDQRQGRVLGHAEMGQQEEGLEHEAQMTSAEGRPIVLRQREDVCAVEVDAAGIRVLETGDQVEKRRLSAARFAHDGDEFAGREIELHRVEQRAGNSAAEGFAQTADAEHELLSVRLKGSARSRSYDPFRDGGAGFMQRLRNDIDERRSVVFQRARQCGLQTSRSSRATTARQPHSL
jgi:hypothetical protein